MPSSRQTPATFFHERACGLCSDCNEDPWGPSPIIQPAFVFADMIRTASSTGSSVYAPYAGSAMHPQILHVTLPLRAKPMQKDERGWYFSKDDLEQRGGRRGAPAALNRD